MRSKIKIIFSMKQLYLTCGVFDELKNVKSYKNVYYSDGTSSTNRLQHMCRSRINFYSKNLTLGDKNVRDNQIKSLQERVENVH